MPKQEELSEFNKTYERLLSEGVDRKGVTYGSINEHLGVTRQLVNHARRHRNAISISMLNQIMDYLDTPDDLRRKARALWLEERLCSGLNGAAIEFILRYLQTEMEPDQYQRLMNQAIEGVRERGQRP